MAPTTAPRSTIAGVLKSHSSGRSTTLTRAPAVRAAAAACIAAAPGRGDEGKPDGGVALRQRRLRVADANKGGRRAEEQPRLRLGRLALARYGDAQVPQGKGGRKKTSTSAARLWGSALAEGVQSLTSVHVEQHAGRLDRAGRTKRGPCASITARAPRSPVSRLISAKELGANQRRMSRLAVQHRRYSRDARGPNSSAIPLASAHAGWRACRPGRRTRPRRLVERQPAPPSARADSPSAQSWAATTIRARSLLAPVGERPAGELHIRV